MHYGHILICKIACRNKSLGFNQPENTDLEGITTVITSIIKIYVMDTNMEKAIIFLEKTTKRCSYYQQYSTEKKQMYPNKTYDNS